MIENKLKELLEHDSIESKINAIKNSELNPQGQHRVIGYQIEQIANLDFLLFGEEGTEYFSVKRLKDNTYSMEEITSVEQILKTGSDHGADLIMKNKDQWYFVTSKIKKGTLSEDSSGVTKLKAVITNLGIDPAKVKYILICRDKNDVNIKTQDPIQKIDLNDLEIKYQKLKNYCRGQHYNTASINRNLKIKRRDWDSSAHFFQRLVLHILLGLIRYSQDKSSIHIAAELFARFRKTGFVITLADILFMEKYIEDLQIDGGILTSISSFKNDLNKTQMNAPINLIDDTRVGKCIDGALNIYMPSLHGDVNRHTMVAHRPSNKTMVVQDEADAIAPTKKKIQGRKQLTPNPKVNLVITGTNIERGVRGFIPDVTLRVKYTDMLKFKHREGVFHENDAKKAIESIIHDFGTFKNIDHPAFQDAINFLTEVQKNPKQMDWMVGSVQMYPDKHYHQAKYRNTGHNNVIKDNSEYLNDVNKCFTDVALHENTLETAVRALLGTVQDPDMMWLEKELNIAQFNKVMRHPMDEGIIFWLPADAKNKEVYAFEERVQKWAPNYEVGALIGSWEDQKGTNSHEVEKRAFLIKERAKQKNKKGVILIMRKIGERSFSPHFITTGVAFYDGGNLHNCIQQDHRPDTPGETFSGHPKQDSLFVSLSVNPDRVSPIDQINMAGSTGNINDYHSIPGINFWKKDKYGNAVKLEKGEQAQHLTNKGVKYLINLLSSGGVTIPSNLIDLLSDAYTKFSQQPNQRKVSNRNLKKGKSQEKEEVGFDPNNVNGSTVDTEAQAYLFLKRVLETLATVRNIANHDTDDMSEMLDMIQNDPNKLNIFLDVYNIEPQFIKQIVNQHYSMLFNTVLTKIRMDRVSEIESIMESV